jgi:hypothetical protein
MNLISQPREAGSWPGDVLHCRAMTDDDIIRQRIAGKSVRAIAKTLAAVWPRSIQ